MGLPLSLSGAYFLLVHVEKKESGREALQCRHFKNMRFAASMNGGGLFRKVGISSGYFPSFIVFGLGNAKVIL